MSVPPPQEEGFFGKLGRSISETATKAKNAVTGALPGAKPAVTDSYATQAVGAGREPKGCTITGGRRYRKKKGKQARKTRRRSRR